MPRKKLPGSYPRIFHGRGRFYREKRRFCYNIHYKAPRIRAFFCSSLILLFFTEKLLCLYRVQGKGYRGHEIFLLIWAETGNILQSATLYAHFSESKESPARINGAKDFRGSNAAAKAWLRGGFHSKECKRLPQLATPPKFQKLSFRIVHKAVLRNRRATGARMGLVSKHRLVDIMQNSCAMSRCGLRKLRFKLKSTILTRYFTVNRTRFSAQLAVAR